VDTPNIPRQPALVEDLTEREMDVLRLMGQGLSNREIAEQLVIALSTVKWYVGHVYGKLGVKNRRQAVARAQALGLIEGQPGPGIRPRHNLPAQMTPFIGRDQERVDLVALLADPEVRLITILAPGGMGKTRLGLAVAEAHLDRFADGVYMVPLAPLRAPEQIVTAIADATSFAFLEDERSPKQQVLDFLRHKHMLLVLDNFEHLLDGAGLVSEILQAASAVQVVVTSRERLNLSGETAYTISGMIFPDWETPEDALEYDAVRLFMQRAEQVCPGFEIPPDDLRYLACICRLVEGMPLGIVLAAAWTEVLSLKEIADEIQHSFDFLAAEMRDVPRRQWSIRAVFQPTWERLSARERDVFMRCAVFRGGCTREAAQTVTGADLRTLQVLINKALLDRDPAGRYTMHELLRQYAQQQLELAGEADTTRDAHSRYFAKFMHTHKADLFTGDQVVALDIINADYENVRRAWYRAVETEDLTALSTMVWAIWRFSMLQGRGDEIVELWRIALPVGPGTLTQAQIMGCYGKAIGSKGGDVEDERAIDYLQQAAAIARTHDDPFTLAMALGWLSLNLPPRSNPADAYQLLDEALALARDLDDRWLECVLTFYQEFPAIHQENDPAKASEYARRGLAIAQEIGSCFEEGLLLRDVGFYHVMLGEYPAALDVFQHGLALEPNWRYHRMNYLHGQAAVYLALGDYKTSGQTFEESIALCQENGDRFSVAYNLCFLSDSLECLGDDQAAKDCLDEVESLMQPGERWPKYHIQRAKLAYGQGDYSAALDWLQPITEMKPYISALHMPGAAAIWGLTELAQGNISAARQQLRAVVKPDATYVWALTQGLYAVAALYRAEAHYEQAAELAAFVEQYPGTSHEYKLYAAKLLNDLQQDLPPDAFEAAVARGTQRDLPDVCAEVAADLADQD
jgi:predicted ATPase/DNA-binding CsgD family transcriptional regulator